MLSDLSALNASTIWYALFSLRAISPLMLSHQPHPQRALATFQRQPPHRAQAIAETLMGYWLSRALDRCCQWQT